MTMLIKKYSYTGRRVLPTDDCSGLHISRKNFRDKEPRNQRT